MLVIGFHALGATTAKEYWQGLQVDGGREEILFEGRMKVLEILETKSTITEPPCTPS